MSSWKVYEKTNVSEVRDVTASEGSTEESAAMTQENSAEQAAELLHQRQVCQDNGQVQSFVQHPLASQERLLKLSSLRPGGTKKRPRDSTDCKGSQAQVVENGLRLGLGGRKQSANFQDVDVDMSPAGVERRLTCGLCGEKGHNKRTCPHAVREKDSDLNNTQTNLNATDKAKRKDPPDNVRPGPGLFSAAPGAALHELEIDSVAPVHACHDKPAQGRQSDFEGEVESKLQIWCGEPTTWNTKKKVIEAFKTSPMWAQWVKAGHNEQKLVNLINRLKVKHLEDRHNKDTGASVDEFEAEVVEKLNQCCGETSTSTWNTKKKILDNFKGLENHSTTGSTLTGAPFSFGGAGLVSPYHTPRHFIFAIALARSNLERKHRMLARVQSSNQSNQQLLLAATTSGHESDLELHRNSRASKVQEVQELESISAEYFYGLLLYVNNGVRQESSTCT
jgi:hypothetical protein